MRLPPPGEPRSEPDRGPARWLTVGPGPAAGLARRPPAGVVAEHAAGVHEALGALSARPFDRVLVTAGALTSRPRAALRALQERAAAGEVTVLGALLPPPVERAARSLDVATCADAADLAPHGAPAPAPTEPVSGLRPPGPGEPPEPVRLPRADAGTHAARAVDAGTFAEGCLARLQHPGRLAGYLLRTLAEASDAARVSLMLTDGAGRSLVLRAGRGLDPALLHKVRVPIGVGVAGRAAALGRPLTGLGSPGGARAYPGGAYVVLPLGRGGACEGVISLTGFPHDALPPAQTIEGWIHVVRRAGQALRSARKLRRAEARSARDVLTGLPNRRAFERALRREVDRAGRAGRGLGVALLDVDRFKSVNDVHGHDAGDRALAEVARRLSGALRDSDLVARWGGEEFAVLLPDLAPGGDTEALAAVERARRAVGARPVVLGLGQPSVTVTISGGVAVGPGRDDQGAGLLHAADQALLRAKAEGRDRILPGAAASA